MKELLYKKRNLLLILLPIAGILILVSRFSSNFSEWYSINISGRINAFANVISSVFPFSLHEILVYALLCFLFVYLVLFFIKKDMKARCLMMINLLCIFSCIMFISVSSIGVSYGRKDFSEAIHIEKSENSAEELNLLTCFLAQELNSYREMLSEDELQVVKTELSFSEIAQECEAAMSKLWEKYSLTQYSYGKAKKVIASPLMSYMGITGMFSPVTSEANINTDIPQFTQPFTICHELAHLRGYMKENEANFISYLACLESENISIKYSGTLSAFNYCANALAKTSYEDFIKIKNILSEGVLRDLRYEALYWNGFEGSVSDISDKINDMYLKANSQESGSESYNEVVYLLLAYYKNF